MKEQDKSTLKMTRSGARLHQPLQQEAGESLIYGIGFPMQVSPTEVALLVNIRNTGAAVVDFENGWDIVVFDALDKIRPERALKGWRNEPDVHPRTGQELTMVAHLPNGGFVPLGAKLADGRPHPHAGTGFGLAVVQGYPTDNSLVNAHVAPDMHRYLHLAQFRYDGRNFEVTRVDKLNPDEFLPDWRVLNRGLSPALADGEDLLMGLVAGNADQSIGSGLSRWRYGSEGWRPIDFKPVNDGKSGEPTIFRDTDGTLLLCARGSRSPQNNVGSVVKNEEDTYQHFLVYRSTDEGESWSRLIYLPDMRAASPITLLQTTTGQPFITANPNPGDETDSQGRHVQIYSQRSRLWFWPLADDRRDIETPYHALDADEILGPPLEWDGGNHDNRWYVDHAIGGLFRLGDGQWHSLVTFRLSSAAINKGGAPPAPEAGCWVEEVFDEVPRGGEAVLPWQF